MRWKSEIWSQSQYGFIWLNVLPLIHNYIYTGHKFVQSPWRDLVIEKNKYCIPARNFAFSRKIIAFPWENVHLQNIFILSQKYWETLRSLAKHFYSFAKVLRNFTLTRKTFSFFRKSIEKLCVCSQNIFILSQNYCVPLRNFIFSC